MLKCFGHTFRFTFWHKTIIHTFLHTTIMHISVKFHTLVKEYNTTPCAQKSLRWVYTMYGLSFLISLLFCTLPLYVQVKYLHKWEAMICSKHVSILHLKNHRALASCSLFSPFIQQISVLSLSFCEIYVLCRMLHTYSPFSLSCRAHQPATNIVTSCLRLNCQKAHNITFFITKCCSTFFRFWFLALFISSPSP